MKSVFYISADNIVSPLGFDTETVISNLLKEQSGIKEYNDLKKSQVPFWASLFEDHTIDAAFDGIKDEGQYTKLEKLLILSINDALSRSPIDIKSPKTLIVISSAKGNVDLLEKDTFTLQDEQRILLTETGRIIQRYFANPNPPLIISNGCISGVLSLITASRILSSGGFENVVITGGDIISEFTISGFQSFKALSSAPCKPFDISRTGLNLGEGAATIILTNKEERAVEDKIAMIGGAVTNDANHISGPSRTGEGLYLAIKRALKDAERKSIPPIGFLSAHGTATLYNDEMESLAFKSADLEEVPTNSLKGYFGHTLGAAGLIESVVSIQTLKLNQLFSSKGFEEHGVSGQLNIIRKSEKKEIEACIKTASGFGGCNAAIIFKKNG